MSDRLICTHPCPFPNTSTPKVHTGFIYIDHRFALKHQRSQFLRKFRSFSIPAVSLVQTCLEDSLCLLVFHTQMLVFRPQSHYSQWESELLSDHTNSLRKREESVLNETVPDVVIYVIWKWKGLATRTVTSFVAVSFVVEIIDDLPTWSVINASQISDLIPAS